MLDRYRGFKASASSIKGEDMADLGEEWLITAATGAGIGLLSAALGGLDHKVFGLPIPVDGLVSIGLGVAGLEAQGDMARTLKVASIAAGGSAAVRTFEGFFKSGLHLGTTSTGFGHGYTEQLPPHMRHMHTYAYGFGGGASEQDRLIEAARHL